MSGRRSFVDDVSPPRIVLGCADGFVFDRDSVRALDEAAINQFGVPSIVLMENAGAAIAAVALEILEAAPGAAMILCGPGNNGGDGFALARRLTNLSKRVAVVLLRDAESYSGDAATNLNVIRAMGVTPERLNDDEPEASLTGLARSLGDVSLIVDGLFGTGLTSPPRDPFVGAIRWINAQCADDASPPFILSIDIPSGLDCDSGEPLGDSGETVRADVTVTLAGWKLGMLREGSQEFTGRVLAGDIGAPRALLDRFGRRRQG